MRRLDHGYHLSGCSITQSNLQSGRNTPQRRRLAQCARASRGWCEAGHNSSGDKPKRLQRHSVDMDLFTVGLGSPRH
jgi:hypothetical protein